MLTKKYMASVKNLPAILLKIVEGTAPSSFNSEHLKGLGFKSSTDRAIVPILKELGFLSGDGTPTQRYHNYRNPSLSKKVMGEALLEAYEDLFHINANPTKGDREAIMGKFKSEHNVKDRVAELQAMTFFALLDHADIKSARSGTSTVVPTTASSTENDNRNGVGTKANGAIPQGISASLRYNIEIHLPATKDVEVYNAIFKSLKEHLVD